MPYLGDYIGHLLAEITIARLHADLEALRVAELYNSHPLLRHMPIPRYRLPTVILDVPVVIARIEEPKRGEPPRGGADSGAMKKTFTRLLSVHLKRAAIDVSEAEKRHMAQAVDDILSHVAPAPDAPLSVVYLGDELVYAVTQILRDPNREPGALAASTMGQFEEGLRSDTRVEFLRLRQAPPRLHILATTAELREAGPSEILARLHLTISEEGLEWTVIESRGRSTDRLVPE